MNMAGLVIIGLGGVGLVIAWNGTHNDVFKALGISQIPAQVPAVFNPTGLPVATPQQIDNRRTNNAGEPSGKYQQIAWNDANAVGIDATDFVKQIQQESGFNPNARSSAGAIGIAQFMPSTAAGLGIDPNDPNASLNAAANLMASYIKQYGSEDAALASYNAGPGAYEAALQASANTGGNWIQELPAETQNYIKIITGDTSPQ